jgi:two-component system LytT family sensor kinase
LRGGRRLLSDDLALLEGTALAAARRVDALRVARERWGREVREREIRQLATEAELRALRAQLNPHFLFNALTTVGHLLQESPERARGTLLRLTGLLRAVLRPATGGLVSLGEEMEIVEAYLAIEQARFEERLRVRLDVPGELRTLRLPALLLQPLVENAVKHGITPLRAGGAVSVHARLEPAADGGAGERLHLTVSDTGAGVTEPMLQAQRGRGLGLASVEQRLERHFGAAASFAFRSVPGEGTSVELRLPVLDAPPLDRGAAAGRPEARTRGLVSA